MVKVKRKPVTSDYKAEGYCLGCADIRKLAKGHYVEQMINGRKRLVGKCIKCGRGMSIFLPTEAVAVKKQTVAEHKAAKKRDEERRARNLENVRKYSGRTKRRRVKHS